MRTKHKARILLYDVETAPALANIWSLYQREGALSTEMLVSTGRIISWRAKIYGEKKVFGADEYSHSYKDMIKLLHEEFDKAHIVCGYNSNSFDNKLANHAFIKMGLPAPTPYHKIDLLKVARKHFKFTSNRLGFVCKELGLDVKEETGGFRLWKGWLEGDKDSIKLMRKYNCQDVIITEQLYDRLKGWIDTHPNVNVYDDKIDNTPQCPNCGSTNLHYNGWRISNTNGKYRRTKCGNCHATLRGRFKEGSKNPLSKHLVFDKG